MTLAKVPKASNLDVVNAKTRDAINVRRVAVEEARVKTNHIILQLQTKIASARMLPGETNFYNMADDLDLFAETARRMQVLVDRRAVLDMKLRGTLDLHADEP